MQLSQLFETPFVTLTVYSIHLTLFRGTLKHTLPNSFQTAPNSSSSDSLFMRLMALYKCFTYLLTFSASEGFYFALYTYPRLRYY